MLVMFDPIALPTASSSFPQMEDVSATKISAAEAPNAIMVRPIDNADMLRLGALATKPTTKKSVLLHSTAKRISGAALDKSIVHGCKKDGHQGCKNRGLGHEIAKLLLLERLPRGCVVCAVDESWARFEIGISGEGWALRRCLRIGSGMRCSSAMMTRFGRGSVFDGFSRNRKTCA